MPKVMCPICKEVFTSRSKLTEHKAKTGHTGGAVIYVEPPKADKKKTNKAKSSKKPHSCPRCDRSFKNKKALENHQRDKKHFDVGKIVKKKKTIQKTLPEVSVKEVITTTPIVGDGYVVIRNKDYEKIMEDLEVLKNFVKLENISFEMLPQTSSWLVSYQLANESDWDYILFYCDFVEIEHTLESFIALENKLNLNNKPIVFDLASLDEREGISKDIYISQECLMITQKEDEKVSYGDMLVSLQQKISSENNSLTSSDLLLVGGSWNKPKPLAPKYDSTITTKWTKQQGAYGSRYYEDDYYGMSIYGAEENIKDSSLEADEGVVEDKIEIFNTNPVYLITNERLCIDKLVNVELVVIPKENPSEDDVKKKVNIEDDVKKKVNIEDDVKKKVNIEDDVKKKVNIEDDVQEEVNIEDDVQEEVKIEDDVQEGKIIVRGSKKLNVKGKPFKTDTYFIITETPKNRLIGRTGWKNLSLNATLFRMWEDGYFSEDLDGTEHSLKNIVEFFKKNPESMFSFREMGVTTDIFTNFVVSESEKPTLTYDIVNIIDFDSKGIYTDKELVKVDMKEYPVSKALDVKIDDLDFDNWYYIDNSFNNKLVKGFNYYGREVGGRNRDGLGMFMSNGISLDWLNQNSELMKEYYLEGSKWAELEREDVVIGIRNKTKKNTSNPIFDKKPRHILLYTNFKLNDDNDLEYDEYKMGFYSSKGHDPSLLYIMSDVGKKNKKNPLKRFYPKTGNKRNYYLFQNLPRKNEKITTYSDFDYTIRGGKPLGDNLNRLIDIIEKTPMENFDNMNSNKNLGEISEDDIVAYLYENPQSLFLYHNWEESQSGDDEYSIFTNFDLKIRHTPVYHLPRRILQYDIIRISADGAADLTEVKEVIRHKGMRVESLDENNWTYMGQFPYPYFQNIEY